MIPTLPAAQRSPEAYAHYRQLVQRFNCSPIVVNRDIEVTEAEMTWCELTALEVLAFGIDPRLFNALMWAHVRYQAMVGVVDIEFDEFIEVERAAYPEFFHGQCIVSADEAAAFMAIACEVPYTQALLWVARVQVQNVRSNVIEETIITPGWAYGYLDRPAAPVTEGFNDMDDDIPF